MQNKINTFNRASKTPLYNSRNLMYQGRKYIEFKTPKSRNSSKDNLKDINIEKVINETTHSDKRPDAFNFDNVGVNIAHVKLNTAESILNNCILEKNDKNAKQKKKLESKSEPRNILSDK